MQIKCLLYAAIKTLALMKQFLLGSISMTHTSMFVLLKVNSLISNEAE